MTSAKKNGKLDINLDLHNRFRKLVEHRFGWKKGNLKLASEEAITEWCEKVEKQISETSDK